MKTCRENFLISCNSEQFLGADDDTAGKRLIPLLEPFEARKVNW